MEVEVVVSPGDPLRLLGGGERGAGQVDVAALLHEDVPVPVYLGLTKTVRWWDSHCKSFSCLGDDNI